MTVNSPEACRAARIAGLVSQLLRYPTSAGVQDALNTQALRKFTLLLCQSDVGFTFSHRRYLAPGTQM